MSRNHANPPQMDQDLPFQRVNWGVERIGWIAMATVLVAALLGLFGRGWLSHTIASDASDRLVVEYDRFLRADAKTELRVHARSGKDTLHLSFDAEYLRAFEMDKVIPEPLKVTLTASEHTYVFSVGESAARVEVALVLLPKRCGKVEGRVRSDEASVAISHFVYP